MWRLHLNSVLGSLALGITVLFCATLARAAGEETPDELETTAPHTKVYWLGVHCTSPSKTLRSQLNLEEKTGLVVRRVVHDSPAAEADIRQHDVILQFGDTRIGRVRDLVEAVDRVQDRETKMELIRGGKQMSVAVQPAERPGTLPSWADAHDMDAIRRWSERLSEGKSGRMKLRFIHPEESWPRIMIDKDGQVWEWEMEDLDELSKSIAPHLERWIPRGSAGPSDDQSEEHELKRPEVHIEDDASPASAAESPSVPPGESADRLRSQIRSLEQKLQGLQEEFKNLRQEVVPKDESD